MIDLIKLTDLSIIKCFSTTQNSGGGVWGIFTRVFNCCSTPEKIILAPHVKGFPTPTIVNFFFEIPFLIIFSLKKVC